MRRRLQVGVALAAAVLIPLAISNCSAGTDTTASTSGFGGNSSLAMSSSTSTTTGSGGSGGTGGGLHIPDSGPSDGNDDVMKNPCGTACGPVELCDDAHIGLDDNCDGNVDEGCTCTPGEAHSCFKGDATYLTHAGCYPGTEKCTENGTWGPCIGGVHAIGPDPCYNNDTTNCHPISTEPFVDIGLETGTGAFSMDADPGSETWTVACPVDVSPCPTPGTGGPPPPPPDDYKPLQSGEYTVTYNKTVMGVPSSCQYPLFVGAPGLRVELSWEHPVPPGTNDGTDLDLHLHKPMDTTPWRYECGSPTDCCYGNCTASDFSGGFGTNPTWFPTTNMPPDPVNWYKDPVFDKNSCYFSPRGAGMEWQGFTKGCHSPRLDLDNTGCDPGITNPNDDEFCAPENVNIDYPPKAQWMRISAYYFNASQSYAVHPTVKVYCDGQLAAELGNHGFYIPEAPVAFQGADGTHLGQGNIFWEVADVAFLDQQCATSSSCIVKPLYSDATNRIPYLVSDIVAQQAFGPPYPPVP